MIKNLLFAATAFVAISMGANAQETISFEASEGFSLGDINGQNGWATLATNEAGTDFILNQSVSDDLSTDGLQSLKIDKDDRFNGMNIPQVGAYKIFETPISASQISFDFYGSLADGSGSDFVISAESETGISFYIDFSYNGSIYVADEATNEEGEQVLGLVNTGTNWSAMEWYNVEVVKSASSVEYYINDNLIHTSTGLAVDTGSIGFFQFMNNNWGGYAYLDNIQFGEPTSTENFAKLGLNVFPNPVSDIVNITSPEANIEAVTITDLNGRTVKSINFNNVAETTVDASDLASGIYLMNITANGTVATQKIVKK